jgi:sugar phosphate isomerase/epimerase
LRKAIAEDLKKTLGEVAKIGYRQVEPYGFPSPQSIDMIKRAKDLGMRVHSSHFTWDSLLHPEKKGMRPFAEVLETAREHELTDLVVPYLHNEDRKDLEAYKKTAETLNRGAELSAEAGIRLAYHNHAFEFKPMTQGKTGYDVFVESFSPRMFFEVDVFWVKLGGVDPIAQLAKLENRVSQLHLKDLQKGSTCPNFDKVQPEAFDEIGDGMIPMIPIMQAAQKFGVKHCHVEQDHSPDPLASVRKSLDFLRSQ